MNYKMAVASFLPFKSHTRISPVAHLNEKETGKEILGNGVQPSQVNCSEVEAKNQEQHDG